MLTASQKKRENIACGLDIDRIQADVIDRYTGLSSQQLRQMREWYESLIDMMRREGVTEKGHLQLNKNVIIALDDLHRRLMADPKFATYNAEFYRTLPYIVELRAKSGENKAGEIETCFNALYGLLRLQGRKPSDETEAAARQISKFLAMLAAYYKKDYNNELFKD